MKDDRKSEVSNSDTPSSGGKRNTAYALLLFSLLLSVFLSLSVSFASSSAKPISQSVQFPALTTGIVGAFSSLLSTSNMQLITPTTYSPSTPLVELTANRTTVSAEPYTPTNQNIVLTATATTGTSPTYEWTIPSGLSVVGSSCSTSSYSSADTCEVSSTSESGTYTVSVSAEANGVPDGTNSITLYVTKPLEVSLTANRTLISAGQSVTLNAIPSQGTGNYMYTYSFYSGEGITENPDNANVFTFANPGIYTITVNANDLTLETAANTVSITVNQPLQTSITANRTLISAGQNVILTDSASQGTGSYQYNNSFYLLNLPPSNIPVNPSVTSTFQLTEFDNDFLWTSVNAFFAPAAPYGTWSATPEGCYNQPVPGTGICATYPNGYANLGGSNDLGPIEVLSNGNLLTPIYGYPSNVLGNQLLFIKQKGYNYTLFSDNLTLPSSVTGTPFTQYEYWSGSLTFSGSPSESSFLHGKLYQWDLVHEPQSDSSAVLAAYPEAVYDGAANAWLVGVNVYILENQCYPSGCPIPSNAFSMAFPTFSDTLSSFPAVYGGFTNVSIVKTGANEWQFNTPGNYLAVVSANDLSGEYASSSVAINVTPQLTTQLTANRTYISAGQSVHLTNTTSGGTGSNTYTYTSNQSNGVTFTGNNALFNEPGNYVLTLTVNDISGEVATNSVEVNVTPVLTTTLIANRTLISAGQSIKFTNTTLYGTGSDSWTYVLNNTSGVSQSGNIFTFNTPGNYLVTLTANDLTGEMSSSSVKITVTDTLGLKLFANKHKIVQKTTVTFTNTTTGGTGDNQFYYTVSNSTGVTWSQTTNSFTVSNELGITWEGNKIRFDNTGSYNVVLHVSDLSGETNESNVIITVDEPLLINGTNTATPIVSQGQLVNITDEGAYGNSGVPPYTYQWYVATPSTFFNNFAFIPANGYCLEPTSLICDFPTNAMTVPGEYAFYLQVTDNETPPVSTDTPLIFITVDPALEVSLTASPGNYISPGQSVTLAPLFTGGTGGVVYSYSFPSGEGITQNALNANVFTFANKGSFEITINASDNTGEVASNTITIDVSNSLTTSLTANRTLISADQSVYLTNSTSGGTGGNTYTYTSNPSTGVTFTGNNAVFADSGNYVLTLTVNDISGEVATNSVEVDVTNALEVSLTANRTTVSPGQSVTLSATPSQGTGSYMYSYSFPSGAGITENALNANVFTFSTAGNFIITVNANDLTGEAASNSVTIDVTNALTTQLTANTTSITAGQSVHFTNMTQGGTGGNTYTYTSNPSTGVTFTGNNALFANSGNYVVTLTVNDITGETASNSVTIDVSNDPFTLVSFTISANVIKLGQTDTLTATVANGVPPYTYDFQIFNSNNATVANRVYITSDTTNSFVYTANAVGTFSADVYVTDSEAPPVTVSDPKDFTVNNGTSGPVSFTVVEPVAVNVTPASQSINMPNSATFTAHATGGSGNYIYQWYNDTSGTPVTMNGMTGSALTVPGTSVGTFTYYVNAADKANALDNANSNNAILEVAQATTTVTTTTVTTTTIPYTPSCGSACGGPAPKTTLKTTTSTTTIPQNFTNSTKPSNSTKNLGPNLIINVVNNTIYVNSTNNDTVQLLVNGTVVKSGLKGLKYNGLLLAPGVYSLVGKDAVLNSTTAPVIYITPGLAPTLKFVKECSSYNYTNNSSCTTTAEIITYKNELSASLYVNGTYVGTTNTTISDTVSKPGVYTYVFNTTGNGAYAKASISYSFAVSNGISSYSGSNKSYVTPALLAVMLAIITGIVYGRSRSRR